MSYPSNLGEILDQNDPDLQDLIKAQYNRAYEEKWNLKKGESEKSLGNLKSEIIFMHCYYPIS